MVEGLQIRGGAGEFEAAVIAVVLDQLAREESSAAERGGDGEQGLSAWIRSLYPEEPNMPREVVWPDS